MSLIESTRFASLEVQDDQLLSIPKGLIGIPDSSWLLITREPESPFLWLQSAQDPSLALVVTQPEIFYPDYTLSLAEEQLTEIGLQDGDEVEVLCIIKAQGELPEWGINLRGPLVFDAGKQSGAQMVNLSEYPVAAPLWQEKGINQIEVTHPQLPILAQPRGES